MEANTNHEIRGRGVCVDLDKPFLCEKDLLQRGPNKCVQVGRDRAPR